jgi:inhibitor of KinA
MLHSAAGPFRFLPSSDQSLLVYFGESITLEAHQQVRRFLHLLKQEPIAGVLNLHPAYCSVLIKFDARKWRHQQLQDALAGYLPRLQQARVPESREVRIPVCYGHQYGPDLQDVSVLLGMTPEQVIELHSSTTYIVYFLGFVPGFAYLGELPRSLVTSRLDNPRRSVPPGSVGIAGNQTGVYPFATPGGWRLLGRTPVSIFRPDRAELSLLSIGDRVRFTPISTEEFSAAEKS